MRRVIPRGRVADALAIIALIVMSVIFVFVNVGKHQTMSPIDEFVYLDYVAKVPTQGVVHRGEETGQLAREELSCRGVRAIGYYPAELCAADGLAPDESYPNAGLTSADIYTPLYPAITWAGAQVLAPFGFDLLEGARATGWIWIAGAGVMLYIALRRWGAPRLLGFGVATMVAISPASLWANSYISTDGTALAAGAAMLLLTTIVFRRPGVRLAVFGAVSALVVLFKFQNISAVAFAALMLGTLGVLRSLRRARRGDGTFGANLLRDWDVRTALVAAGSGVLAQAIWFVVRALIAVGPPPDQGAAQPISVSSVLFQTVTFIPSLLDPAAPGEDGLMIRLLAVVGSLLLAAGAIGLFFAARPGDRRAVHAGSAIAAAVILGPALAIATTLAAGYFFSLPHRYGLALAPVFAAALAVLLMRRRWSGPVVAAFGVAGFVVLTVLTPTV